MKIKMLRTTVAENRIVRAGSVQDVSDSEANNLILLGKAVSLEEVVVVEPTEELTTENTPDVVAEDRPKRGKQLRKAKS